MATFSAHIFLLLLHIACIGFSVQATDMNEYFKISWGEDHVQVLDGHQFVLSLDNYSGSGCESKKAYGSGSFQIKIKLPAKKSDGVVTAFYLTSVDRNQHDEIDFEFLGNHKGEGIVLQTNIFVNGIGGREERIHLGFDPTTSFHSYTILWNEAHTVFYVDNKPIREYGNANGLAYPTKPMKIMASLWDGDTWATDGGKSKIDWSFAPFTATFRDFQVNGCQAEIANDPKCSHPSLP